MSNVTLVGSTLGKYQIQAEIGRGGMGAVYKGYDPTLDRYVAIKVLAPHLVWQEGFVERFMREARLAARLQHPNIVTIYDVGHAEQAGLYYYVMEYLEGQTLTELIQQQGQLPAETVVSLLSPLANALDYAHHNGLVHRDIKPANIIVSRTGRVTLTDFGIARAAQETHLTATGTTVGTPQYMSPEQVQAGEVDARSDQYSLAVVAYELLSGRVPFHADSTLALMYKVVHEPPPPLRQARPQLPAQVEQVLARALAKDPGNRFATVSAFVEALGRALAGPRGKGTAAKPAPAQKAAAPAVAAAAAAAGVAARQPRPPTPPPTARPAAPPARPAQAGRRFPIWILALAGLTVVVLALAVVMALGKGGGKGTPTAIVVVVTSAPTQASGAASPSPQVIVVTPVPTAEAATAEPAPTQVAATSVTTPQPVATLAPPATPAASAPTQPPADSTAPTPSPVPTATRTPAAAATDTPKPQPTKPKVQPTVTQVAVQMRAPNLLEPADGQGFTQGDQIVLRWEPVGKLPADGYYAVTVLYTPSSAPGQRWPDDPAWTKEPSYVLSDRNYLPSLSADSKFTWSVQVMRKTGQDAKGFSKGSPLSPRSGERTLIWKAAPSGGGGGGGGGDTNPPRPLPTSG